MLPQRFGKTELTEKELKNDRKTCIKAGPCGLGRRALYLNTFFLDRRLYACYEDIERIYKRIAMSAGGLILAIASVDVTDSNELYKRQ